MQSVRNFKTSKIMNKIKHWHLIVIQYLTMFFVFFVILLISGSNTTIVVIVGICMLVYGMANYFEGFMFGPFWSKENDA